jgi:hypothetical protein
MVATWEGILHRSKDREEQIVFRGLGRDFNNDDVRLLNCSQISWAPKVEPRAALPIARVALAISDSQLSFSQIRLGGCWSTQTHTVVS